MIGKVSFGRPIVAKILLYRDEILARGVSLENFLPSLKFSDLLSIIKINEHPSLFDKTALTDDEAHECRFFEPRLFSSSDWDVDQCERVMLEYFSDDHLKHA